MSKAFDQAIEEIKRVWDASDQFDTKVLQFTGIVFAGGAILGDKFHLTGPNGWWVILLVIVGSMALIAFGGLALRATIGIRFAAPLDPRLLADKPAYLRDDQAFEETLLPGLAVAFEQCLNAHEQKVTRFRQSWWVLAFAVNSLLLALMLGMVDTVREARMSEKDPKAPVEAPKPAAPKPETSKPVLGPYTITRGRTLGDTITKVPPRVPDSTERK